MKGTLFVRFSGVLIAMLALVHSPDAFSSAFGRTKGSFGVSPSGASQYSIPIWAPPGPRGIQPAISIAYNSQSGIGPLGVGWSFQGLGAVMRCNKTYAQDGAPAGVALAASDGYCVNGNRLRLVSGTYGSAGSTYETEIADFSNVTADATSGVTGIGYFVVQGRNGLTYYYGYTDANGNGANSAVLASGTTTVSEWLLSKIVDRAGNNLVVNYTSLTGAAVPNTILWTPTSEGASTYAYTMTFNYGANVPQSSLTQYIGGTAATNAELLSSISIKSSGTVIKDYFLSYQASPTTGRDQLYSVQECADSAKDNCLLPTTIGYQNGVIGVSTTATSAASTAYNVTARYDLNGDGIPDLIYAAGTGVVVAFGSPTGYGTPVSLPNGAYLFGNLTGGKEDGYLTVVSGVWWYYTWNSSTSTFTGISTGLTYDTTAIQFQLADVNGDGLPDLISVYQTYNANTKRGNAFVDFRLNTGAGGAPTFSSTLTQGYYIGGPALQAQLLTPDMQFAKLRRYDFNGDGLDDLVLQTNTGSDMNYFATTYELISTGTGYTATEIESVGADEYPNAFFTDWNDDACTDYVTLGTLYVSGCNGSVAASYTLGNTVVGALDWDGDGRTDLVVNNGSTLGVYLSTGGAPGTVLATSIPYASTCTYVTMDANGDGLDDLGCSSSAGNAPLTYYLHNGAGEPPDLVTSITDGFGNSASPTYVAISRGGYSNYSDGVFPYMNYGGPMYVTNQVTYSDPSNLPSGTYQQTFYYDGAWMNLQGRGFSGFAAMQIYDSRNTLWETQDFDRTFPYTGMLTNDIVAEDSLNTKPIKKVTNTLLDETLISTANNEAYFPYVSSATSVVYEVGGAKNGLLITSATTNNGTPDAYGNFDTVTSTITDEDSGSPYYGDTWTSTTVNTITPNTANWCLNLPTETTVTNSSTAPRGTAITRTVQYNNPDYTNCRETEKVVEPSSTLYKVVEDYGYDAFGNLHTDTVTGIGMAARTTTTTWNTTGQFPQTVQNALGQSITLGFDPNSGMKTSQTDPNWTTANPLTTTWAYTDGFYRKTLETRPDGTSTSWSYNNCATNGCVNSNNEMTITQTTLNVGGGTQSVTNVYKDAVQRTLVTSKTMLNGAFDRSEVQYDSLGRVHLQGIPCTFVSCATYWVTNTYDVLNRITESQRPISSTNSNPQTTLYGYAGRTSTVEDALSNTTTQIHLVTGPLARTIDAKGYYVNLTYDAFGSLLSTTDSASPANTLTSSQYSYGIGAFKTATSDMDLGSWSYTPDALGEVTAYTDAKNQHFTTTYDALSRPLVRTEPDLTTTWTWGNTAASYNIGKLQSVTGVSSAGTYSESYTFDSKTRPATKVITIPGDAIYTYTKAYNPTTGLPSTLTYPTSTSGYQLELQYGYANGILSSVTDANSGTVYWTANATNARGQITQETLGNGVVTNRGFDAVTGWVGSLKAGIGGTSAIMNSAYTYDFMGDVSQRQNNNVEGLTENFYYDADYRLDHSTLNGTLNLQMGYDTLGMGNIVSRSDVAGGSTWTYDPVRKHAVTQAGTGGYAFTYDANGNAETRNGYSVTWTSYNMPSGVTSSGESATFQYGPSRQRWQMIYTGSIGTETTYYVEKSLEKVANGGTIDYRHYIYAGSEPVAIYSRMSTGTNTVHYMLEDHQGSAASILTSTGTVDVAESFTAFGNRRSGETWSGAPTSGDESAINAVSREGYTWQTALGVSMGLNHMNGRVQDAITGRFLSPDPTIPAPGNTQAYNRYTYVNNNPLTLTDPSGFSPFNGQPTQPYVKCNDGCAMTAKQQRRANGDPGTTGNAPIGDGTAPISDGISGTNPDDATDPTVTEGSLTVTFADGSSITVSDPNGADTAAAANGAMQSTDQSGTGGDSPNSGGGATNTSQATQGAAQSQNSGCEGSPCLDSIEVNATRIPGAQPGGFTDSQPFPCGGSMCLAEMGTWNSSVYGQQGVHLGVSHVPAGTAWVQTYFRSTGQNSGTFQEDIDPGASSPVYTGYGATSTYFTDSPGAVLGTTGVWVAQTSLVQPNGAGGYSPVITFQWGFSYSPAGVQYIWPVSIAPGSFQQQTIGSMH